MLPPWPHLCGPEVVAHGPALQLPLPAAAFPVFQLGRQRELVTPRGATGKVGDEARQALQLPVVTQEELGPHRIRGRLWSIQ